MIDQRNTNPMIATGTPTLVTGALTVDPDLAASLNGPTNYYSAIDSPSLSMTSSLSIELFLKLASLPGATLDVVRKTGSYRIQVDTSGRVLFKVENGASSVTVTSSAISTGSWYHLICIYNGGYAGTPQFGKTTAGASLLGLEDDNGNNKAVSRFTLIETALLSSVNILLGYTDEIWGVQACGVVYADNAGVPGALVTASPVSYLYPPNPPRGTFGWVSFPVSAAVPAGTYHIGCVTDTVGPPGKVAIFARNDASGGATSRRNDSVTGPSNPFGSVSSATAAVLPVYCDYVPVTRTGTEGQALIYVNGALNASAAYSSGVADTANALEVCPALTAQVDELSIWNKALTAVQVATHFTAH